MSTLKFIPTGFFSNQQPAGTDIATSWPFNIIQTDIFCSTYKSWTICIFLRERNNSFKLWELLQLKDQINFKPNVTMYTKSYESISICCYNLVKLTIPYGTLKHNRLHGRTRSSKQAVIIQQNCWLQKMR